jgi:hypothetical protein
MGIKENLKMPEVNGFESGNGRIGTVGRKVSHKVNSRENSTRYMGKFALKDFFNTHDLKDFFNTQNYMFVLKNGVPLVPLAH